MIQLVVVAEKSDGKVVLFVQHPQVVFHEGWCADLRQRSGGRSVWCEGVERERESERPRKGLNLKREVEKGERIRHSTRAQKRESARREAEKRQGEGRKKEGEGRGERARV